LMEVNKESIFETHAGKVFDEELVSETSIPINAQGFNEDRQKFPAKDIRFNCKKELVYANVMGFPNENIFIRKTCKSAGTGKVKKGKMPGESEKFS
jgi:alpha-L-fucosidase